MEIDQPEEQEEKHEQQRHQEEKEMPHHADILEENVIIQQNPAVNDNSEDCYSKPGALYHRKRSIICMDENGTIIRKKQRRNLTFDHSLDKKLIFNPHWSTSIMMQDISPLVNKMHSISSIRIIPYTTTEEAFSKVGVERRWSGLGPEPQQLQVMMPESIMKVQDGTLWEIDGIVQHKRNRSGTNSYLVRYKDYGPEYDEWMEEDMLITAVGAMKEYWARHALLP